MSPDQTPRARRVLAVEDEPDHLMAVELLFRGEADIEFFGAGTTTEADEILQREPIDLILLDLALPGEDGLAFCKRLKTQERYRALPVIAFSAFPRQIYESRAREAGCTDYFDKPFHPRDLITAVRKHLGVD
ncbi:MAG TPA: response regulator [Candidatus Methanoperedens sp.]|nr:response regulator [Candidatus Methanoperedens sp.]